MKHFERMSDERMILSPQAWEILYNTMVHIDYIVNGPLKRQPSKDDEEILKLRQMFLDDGYDIEVLT